MDGRTRATKPEWDTPPDGDFVRYVERFNAPVFAGSAPQAQTVSTKWAGRLPSTGAVESSAPGAARPPDLMEALAPLAVTLRIARGVLLLLVALHGVVLVLFNQGSLVGLVVMGALWWGVGWLIASLPKAVSSAGVSAPAREAMKERLRQVAEQRKTGKKNSL